MKINNKHKIIKHMRFDSDDDFYFVKLVKRNKDFRDSESNGFGNNKVIKTYCINSVEHLNEMFDEMVCLADFHNARVYFNLNRRSYKRVGSLFLKKTLDCVLNEVYKSIENIYGSVCEGSSSEVDKKWILDFDTKDTSFLDALDSELINIEPFGSKIIDDVETKNGYHLIVKPFNISKFDTFFGNWFTIHKPTIHKEGLTLLYSL